MRTLTGCLIAALAPLALVGCAAAPEGPSSHSLDETEADGGTTPPDEGDDAGKADCDGGTCSHPRDSGHTGDGGQTGTDGPADCEQNNACQTAHDLGAVSGDTGND